MPAAVLLPARLKTALPNSLQAHTNSRTWTAELTKAPRKTLFVAIQRLYVNLYYPSTDHPIANDTLLHHVLISPEVAAEKPGEGQYAVIQTLTSRRKLITLEGADLDPESYWKRRPNLRGGKVGLVSLKEEFAREPGNYMLLNGTVADALLRKALDWRAIVIQTGAGQTITEGRELTRTNDPEAVVYLRDNACPDCLYLRADCQCAEAPPSPPQVCPHCGRAVHDGPCTTGMLFAVPSFSSGLDPKPLNVLAAELRRHMQEHSVTIADIEKVTLGGGKADFINFLGSVLGQNCKASVDYDLHRGASSHLR